MALMKRLLVEIYANERQALTDVYLISIKKALQSIFIVIGFRLIELFSFSRMYFMMMMKLLPFCPPRLSRLFRLSISLRKAFFLASHLS
jgi:hypothetical protein